MVKVAGGRLIIHATNVHQGGGKILLSSLLTALIPIRSFRLFADSRLSINELKKKSSVHRVAPTILARIMAEVKLAREVECGDLVLCFGNLPPMFQLKCRVILFVQNRLLLEKGGLKAFPFRVRLRLLVERYWFASRLKYCDKVLVQTKSMERLMYQSFPEVSELAVMPFLERQGIEIRDVKPGSFDDGSAVNFLYVASGDPHKNHIALIEAWRLLAKDDIRPSLRLTVNPNRHKKLVEFINSATVAYNLRIDNVGALEHKATIALYRQTKAFIYPSMMESFGIPLMEAHHAGIDILASECDYVRDLLDPVQTFDPQSPLSIARAVRRYLGQEEKRFATCTAADFVNNLLIET